ncbi:MAG: cytochrome c [Acidobacteriaceae bacterium]|nr:cytochrome c [Acidobacteriaceae bacterium]
MTAVLAAQSGPSKSREAPKNLRVWDGLYSSEQAARGRAAYMKGCAECHSADLSGHEYAGPLAGFGFQLKWADASIAELFGRMRSMPLGRPGLLERQEYLDILAYVLQQNGYPAGEQELTMGVAAQRWPRILIERQKP